MDFAKLIVVVPTILAISGIPPKDNETHNDRHNTIYPCQDTIFPKTLVSLRAWNKTDLNLQHICAGSLINKEWIITSAQCIYDKDYSSTFVVTADKISSSEYIGEVSEIENVYLHPLHDNETALNDIALVQLSIFLSIDEDDVRYVELPQKEVGNISCPEVTLMGIGRSNLSENFIEIMCTNLKLKVNAKCRKNLLNLEKDNTSSTTGSYPDKLEMWDKVLCGVCSTEQVQNFYSTDLGGPLLCENVLFGIVSAKKVQEEYWPCIATRVDKYLNWIRTTMDKFSYRSIGRANRIYELHLLLIFITLLLCKV